MQHCFYGKEGIHVPDCPFDENVPSNHIADDQLSLGKIKFYEEYGYYKEGTVWKGEIPSERFEDGYRRYKTEKLAENKLVKEGTRRCGARLS